MSTSLLSFIVLLVGYLIGIAIGIWYFLYSGKEEKGGAPQ